MAHPAGLPARRPVVGPFREELTLTSRIPQVILLEGLVAALSDRLGESASAAAALTLEIVSANLAE